MGGWQEYSVVDGNAPGMLRKVDTTHVPLSYYLGAVGMPGVTAWYGLVKIIDPKPGETLVVSAASGAVGSAFGALAKARGCRVVGIAGGPDKCRYVTEELGFDACIDHRAHGDLKSMAAALKEACPDGIDGHFENVGGYILDAVLLRANAFARVALCGMIAGYDGQPLPLQNPALILINRMKIEGFIVSEHMQVWPEALAELGALVASGQAAPARDHRPGPGGGARGVSGPAQRQELRQAAGEADLSAWAASPHAGMAPAAARRSRTMTELILHHYPASPFAHKARCVLGFKRLAWRSVTVPSVMPKPDVVALTGGYRRTPFCRLAPTSIATRR